MFSSSANPCDLIRVHSVTIGKLHNFAMHNYKTTFDFSLHTKRKPPNLPQSIKSSYFRQQRAHRAASEPEVDQSQPGGRRLLPSPVSS